MAKVSCPNCRSDLTYRRETAGEPAHYECREDKGGCGWRWKTNFKGFMTPDKLRPTDMRGA